MTSEDVREQTKIALDKLRLALEEAASSMEDIVKVVIYFKDIGDYEAVKQAELRYYQRHAPSVRWSPFPRKTCSWNSM